MSKSKRSKRRETAGKTQEHHTSATKNSVNQRFGSKEQRQTLIGRLKRILIRANTAIPSRARPVVKLVTAIGATLGMLVTIYQVFPIMEVDVSPVLDQPDPYSARFIINNKGMLSVTEVEVSCLESRITLPAPENPKKEIYAVDRNRYKTELPSTQFSVLQPGERGTATCPKTVNVPYKQQVIMTPHGPEVSSIIMIDALDTIEPLRTFMGNLILGESFSAPDTKALPVASTEMIITLKYTFRPVRLRFEDKIRFVARKNQDGDFFWFREPMSGAAILPKTCKAPLVLREIKNGVVLDPPPAWCSDQHP